MSKNVRRIRSGIICLSACVASISIFISAAIASEAELTPITLKTMGSLFFGGTVVQMADGETFHGDHGYAQFYIPQNSRQYPIIMWHGIGQSGRSWESTPDNREGYQAILTRRDWPVYIIDQPRRGRAGYTQAKPETAAIPTVSRESGAWDAFRNGVWTPPKPATLYPCVQFPRDAVAIDQFFRQQTVNTGEEPVTAEHRAFMGQTVGELLKQTGPAILMTHSNSGQYGWATGVESEPGLIKAIVAYEPGVCTFPEGDRPPEILAKAEGVGEILAPQMIPMEDFIKLTKMPIIIIFGDNIADEPSEIFNVDVWRIARERARQFVETINRYGGDAQLILLPELGFKGNTHAPFADLNNIEIADHLETLLSRKHLDVRNVPHTGPVPKSLESITIPLE